MNKTLATMFHAGKGKRMKGKGCMTLLMETGEANMGVMLALDFHQVFINRIWENPSE
jgi:hypothetical protein